MSDITFKAIIIGVIVDNVATLAVMLFLMTALTSQGLSQDEVVARLKSHSVLLLNLIIGLDCTCLGGYIAGGAPVRGPAQCAGRRGRHGLCSDLS